MLRARTRSSRDGYTIIELLVVIAIITILMGLGFVSYGRVRDGAIAAKTATEISQLSTGVQSFKARFSNAPYIPDGFSLEDDYTDAGSNAADGDYLKRLFPQIDLKSTGVFALTTQRNIALSQNEALVFFLSGGTLTNFTGFSANRRSPFAPFVPGSNEQRIGPFFDFQQARLIINPTTNMAQYADPYGTPYAYFTSRNGGDYVATSTFSYTIPNTSITTTVRPYQIGGRFLNQRGAQVISAGKNRKFGPGGTNWTPGVSPYGSASTDDGGDDLANFGSGALKNP